MTVVKICGITNLDDALRSVEYGADALGFNFYEKSPRYISPSRAAEIADLLPTRVGKVGVFVNEKNNRVVEIANTANLDAIQLHGDETPEYVEILQDTTDLIIIKAFRVSEVFDIEILRRFAIDAALLDGHADREFGGTGKTFDWSIAKQIKSLVKELYLAGGLSPENVGEAIRTVRPYAVDACSCLESRKGVKDPEKLRRFIENAKQHE